MIEKSILEGKFYDITKSEGPEFSVIAEHLSKDTKQHVKQVEDQYRLYLLKRRQA